MDFLKYMGGLTKNKAARYVASNVDDYMSSYDAVATDYQNKFGNYDESVYDADYRKFYDRITSAVDSNKKKTQNILSGLNLYKDILGEEYYNNARKNIEGISADYDTITSSLDDYQKYWSQFQDENDWYNARMFNKYSPLVSQNGLKNGSDVDKAIENTDDEREKKWLSDNKTYFMSNEELESEINRLQNSQSVLGIVGDGLHDLRDSNNIFEVVSAIGNTISDITDNANAGSDLQKYTAALQQKYVDMIESNNELKADLENYNFYIGLRDSNSTNKEAISASSNANEIQEKWTNAGYDFTALYNAYKADSTQGIMNDISKWAGKNPFNATLGTIGSIALSPLKILGTADAVASKLTGNDVNPYDSSYYPSLISSTIRDSVKENYASDWFGKYGGDQQIDIDGVKVNYNLGEFAYDSLTSALDNALNMAIGNVAGSAGASITGGSIKKWVSGMTSFVMGSEVASDRIIQNKAKGYSDEKAVTLGLISGMIEGITEKYSIEAILKDPKTILGTAAKSFVSEGSEEVASNLLNNLTDLIANGNQSEILSSYYRYIADGKTTNEATVQVLADLVSEDVSSFLAGGLAGVGMGAVGTGGTFIDTYNTGRNVNQYGNTPALIQDAGSISGNIDTGKAQRLYEKTSFANPNPSIENTQNKTEEKYNNGEVNSAIENVAEESGIQTKKQKMSLGQKLTDVRSNYATGRLFNAVSQELSSRLSDAVRSAVSQRLSENGMELADVMDYADIITRASHGEEVSSSDIRRLNHNEIASRVMEEVNAAYAELYFQEFLPEMIYDPVEENQWLTSAVKDYTGQASRMRSYTSERAENSDSIQQETVEKNNDTAIESKNTEKDNNVLVDTQAESERVYGKSGTKSLESLLSSVTESEEEAVRTVFDAYYTAGSLGTVDIGDVKQTAAESVLTEEVREKVKKWAFAAGISDEFSGKGNTPNRTVVKNGGVEDRDAAVSKYDLDEAAVSVINSVSKKLGVSVRVAPEIQISGRQARGKYDNGTIYLSAKYADSVYTVFTHEVCHHLKETAPEQYRNFKRFVIENIQKNPKRYAGILGEMKLTYRQVQPHILDMSIMDEIAADSLELFFSDTDFVSEAIEHDRSFVEKVLDAMKKFLEYIRESIRRFGTNDSSRALSSVLQQEKKFQNGVELVDSMLRAGEQTAKSVQKQKNTENDNTDSEIGETDKNTRETVEAKFSLKSPVEETKTLVALHNFDERKIRDTLKLGAFPSPSIAIVKAKDGHSKYGEYSAVFYKDTIDPQADIRNKVYGSDAWTPTSSDALVEYEVDYENKRAIESNIESLSSGIAGGTFRRSSVISSIGVDDVTTKNIDDIAESLSHQDTVRAAYLAEKGGSLEPEYMPKVYNRYGNEALQTYIDRIGPQKLAGIIVEMEASDDSMAPVRNEEETIRKIIRDKYEKDHAVFLNKKPDIKEQRLDKYMQNNVSIFTIEDFIKDAWDYYENGGTVSSEIDRVATSDKLRDAVDDKDVAIWIKGKLNGLIGEPGIYNGSDPYYASGRRKSFSETHYPYTAENIVRAMQKTASERGQGYFGAGAEGMVAMATPEYNSIDDIHADDNRLTVEEENEHRSRLDAIDSQIESIIAQVKQTNEPHSSNPYEESDIIGNILMDTAAKSKHDAESVRKAFAKEGYTLSKALSEYVVFMYNSAAQIPTGYFEAKPQRVVSFNEVAAVIAPDNAPADLVQDFRKSGMNVVTYEAGNDTDRLRALNNIENIKFSLLIDEESIGSVEFMDQTDSGMTESGKTISELADEMTENIHNLVRNGKKLSKAALQELAGSFIDRSGSSMTKKELTGMLSSLLSYIEQNNPDTRSVAEATLGIAERLIDTATYRDDELNTQYKDLRKDILRRKIYVNAKDISAEELRQISALARRRFYITTDNNQRSAKVLDIDEYYDALHSSDPEFFPESSSPSEQFENIIAFLDATSVRMRNIYDSGEMGMSSDEAARILAGEIYYSVAKAVEEHNKGVKLKKSKQSKDIAELYYGAIQDLKQQSISHNQRFKDFAKQKDREVSIYQEMAYIKIAEAKAQMADSIDRRQTVSKLKKLYRESLNLLTGKRSDKMGVPKDFQKSFLDLLELVDFSNDRYPGSKYNERVQDTKKRLQNMSQALEKMYENENGDGNEIVDQDVITYLEDLVVITDKGNKTIYELTTDELKLLSSAIEHMKGLITDSNKMFSEELDRTRDEYGQKIINELLAMPKQRGFTYGTKLQAVHTALSTNQMMPIYFFERIGGTLNELYKVVMQTEGKQSDILEEAVKSANGIMKKYHFDKWAFDSKPKEFDVGGRQVSVDIFEAMSLYAIAKRERGNTGTLSETSHLLNGGIVFKDEKRTVVGNVKESRAEKKNKLQQSESESAAIAVTEQDINRITAMLTDEQKQFADAMVKYLSTDLAKFGNEASRKMFNHDSYLEKYYFPFDVDDNQIASSIDKAPPKQVKNSSFTKRVSLGANSAVVISNFMDVWIGHVSGMAVYAASSPALNDFMRVYNYKDGKNTVKGLLKEKFGNDYDQYIMKLMEDLNGGYRNDNTTALSDQLVRNMKTAAVSMSLSCAIQQVSAIGRAYSYLGINKTRNPSMKGYREMLEHSALARIKDSAGYDTMSGASLIYQMMYGDEKKSVQMKQFFKNLKHKESRSLSREQMEQFGFLLPGLMDSITWSAIWNSCKAQIRSQHRYNAESEEFFTAVTELFDDVIRHTQVYDSNFQRSGNLRSHDSLIKMEMAFMAEPTVTVNMLMSTVQDVKNGKKKLAARKIVSVAFAMVLNSLLKSIMTAFYKWDDDKDYFKNYREDFVDNLISDLGSMMPYVKDIFSIIEGYDVERLDLTSISKLLNAWNQMTSDKKTPIDKITNLAGYLADIFGIPGTTIKKNFYAILNNFILRGADGGVPFDAMIAAVQEGDATKVGQMYDELIAAGYKKSTITSKYRQKMAETIPEVAEAADYLIEGDEHNYYAVCRELLDMGFDQSDIKAAVKLVIKARQEEQHISPIKDFWNRFTNQKIDVDEIEIPDYENPAFDDMVTAVLNGDQDKFTDIYNRLYADGYTDSKIKGYYRQAIADTLPEVSEAAQYYIDGDMGAYSIAVGNIAKMGFELSDVKAAVKSAADDLETGLTDAEKFAESRISDIGTDVAENPTVTIEEELFDGAIYDYDMLYNVLLSQGKNGKDYKEIYRYFLDNGKSSKNIDQEMDNRAEKTVKEWINAVNIGDTATYDNCRKDLINYYGSQEKANSIVNQHRKEQNALIRSYINSSGEKQSKAIEDLIGEYGSWDTALKAIEYYKKNP